MTYTFDEAKTCYQLDKNMMMQIFIPTVEKFSEFEKTGIPWANVVVFVGHKMPVDLSVIKLIHEKGARCIMGTSRNIDRQFIEGKVSRMEDLKNQYEELFVKGIDILETDIPIPLSRIFERKNFIDSTLQKYFKTK